MIWTFGDSFAKHFKESKYFNHLDQSYVEQVSRALDQSVKSFAKPLLTLEHTYENFNKLRNELSKKDIVIVALTNVDRRYFWKNQPLKTLYLNDNEQDAVNYYREYLSNQLELQATFLENFLYNLNALTKKLELHTIVMPSFNDSNVILKTFNNFDYLHISNCSLAEVSFKEFKPGHMITDMMDDLRVNHLCRNNHTILAKKIINNITNKDPLDLTFGFESDFLTNQMLKDPEFTKDQMFGGIMGRLQRIKINRSL